MGCKRSFFLGAKPSSWSIFDEFGNSPALQGNDRRKPFFCQTVWKIKDSASFLIMQKVSACFYVFFDLFDDFADILVKIWEC